MAEKMVEKTLWLKLVVAFHAILGASIVLVALAFITQFSASDLPRELQYHFTSVIFFTITPLVEGVIYLLLAWGLSGLKKWARWGATIFFTLSVLWFLIFSLEFDYGHLITGDPWIYLNISFNQFLNLIIGLNGEIVFNLLQQLGVLLYLLPIIYGVVVLYALWGDKKTNALFAQ